MLSKLGALLFDDEGQGMIEYGLIIALISVALIAILGMMRGSLQGIFSTASGALDSAPSGGGSETSGS